LDGILKLLPREKTTGTHLARFANDASERDKKDLRPVRYRFFSSDFSPKKMRSSSLTANMAFLWVRHLIINSIPKTNGRTRK